VVLLGTVAPFAVRLAVTTSRPPAPSPAASTLSTAGSLVGTFVPALS
jgi:hypothetical protein